VKILRGMTWNHDRGLAPMIATAARFSELHPDTHIEWKARSLQGFADDPTSELAQQFDLLVLDHPFMGTVAEGRFLVPLDQHVAPEVLSTLRKESVGASHDSYFYGGHQWALAIDAAAQVAGYRPDLLSAVQTRVPTTWDEVFELAKVRLGFVTTPLLPVDSFCSFLSLCANCGESPFAEYAGRVIGEQVGQSALAALRALSESAPEEARGWNPIAVWEKMSTTDEIGYCPLAFGYSNYARPDYRRSTIHFTNIPSRGARGPVGSILGGAGLAISATCKELPTALEYAEWVAGAECQATVYVDSGGQPGNRTAWTNFDVNRMSSHFFDATLPTLERAYLRPRFPGFVEFQTQASFLISDFLKGKHSSATTLRLLDDCYRRWMP
jgi:multiple sugar transport system substrate-binding protein